MLPVHLPVTVQPAYGVSTAVHAGTVQPTYGVSTAVQAAKVTGTDAAACCEAPATNTGSESLSPSARAMKDEASRFEKA